ncbi:MAG: bifunctional metallophosphatase/5'-nucleotidase [Ardenticatenales bacterium]|nr:bifunctional metallophosphatase/5'-nucleotidase [Ardenticatenales bacterium]
MTSRFTHSRLWLVGWLSVCVLLLFAMRSHAQEPGVTLLHISDYHSHGPAFYSAGEPDQGGIARLIGYLKSRRAEPNVIILSGGDTMNAGSPAWSDKHQCAEWEWFNGLLDAQALGNHDADYGQAVFQKCQAKITYPILSANVMTDGKPIFPDAYKVFDVGGMRVGIFALAGEDFERITKAENRPVAGALFADRVETARTVVADLQAEDVDAIVLFGHAYREEDEALARAVPGIDVILGTHSHLAVDLTQIEGTETYYISPYQYGTYVSEVKLQREGETLIVAGQLIPMDESVTPDPEIAAQVRDMQAALESDPKYAPLFQVIGEAEVELATTDHLQRDSVLGNLTADLIRGEVGAHVALLTASSFREPIPPGKITEEHLRTTMPYPNAVIVYQASGADIQKILDYSVSRAGSDFFSQVSGLRFIIRDGKATDVQILAAAESGTFMALDPTATYSLATSEFQGRFAGGYKELFAPLAYEATAVKDVRDTVRAYFAAHRPVRAERDGRIAHATDTLPAPTPGALPGSGGTSSFPYLIVGIGSACLVLALVFWRRRQVVS